MPWAGLSVFNSQPPIVNRDDQFISLSPPFPSIASPAPFKPFFFPREKNINYTWNTRADIPLPTRVYFSWCLCPSVGPLGIWKVFPCFFFFSFSFSPKQYRFKCFKEFGHGEKEKKKRKESWVDIRIKIALIFFIFYFYMKNCFNWIYAIVGRKINGYKYG